jgi:hypothetical protein
VLRHSHGGSLAETPATPLRTPTGRFAARLANIFEPPVRPAAADLHPVVETDLAVADRLVGQVEVRIL